MGESTVRDFVRGIRVELAAESLPAVPVVQEHPAGAAGEVDFGEFQAWIAGDRVRLWLFILRLSQSARACAAVFGHQAQEAFFEGHVQAFAHFGGVPCQLPRARDHLEGVVATGVNGHLDLPVGGRGFSPVAVMGSPQSRTRVLPMGVR